MNDSHTLALLIKPGNSFRDAEVVLGGDAPGKCFPSDPLILVRSGSILRYLVEAVWDFVRLYRAIVDPWVMTTIYQ
jgi:hypothetical protein